jgi:hypothetical protein
VNLLSVYRSPVRLFLFGVVGLLLMLTAIDVMWLHKVSTPPDVSDGVLTSTGHNQRRADYFWGLPLLFGGTALFGYAMFSLLRREPILVLRDDGVAFQVGKPGMPLRLVPWEAIDDVYTARDPDPDDGPAFPVVVFDISRPELLPDEPWDAEWDGSRLKVNAVSWERRPDEVVMHARVALEAARRDRRLGRGIDG